MSGSAMCRALVWAQRRRNALALRGVEPPPLVFKARVTGGEYARVVDTGAKFGRVVGMQTFDGTLTQADALRYAEWIIDKFKPEGDE